MLLCIGLVIGLGICALMAIRAGQLLSAALWLAGVSAQTAALIYLLGAPIAAVLELSIGAGLVTVLMVLAISSAGSDALRAPPMVPRLWAVSITLILVLLVFGFTVPLRIAPPAIDQPALAVTLWQDRSADMVLQAALIFTGLLTVLGLLADAPSVLHISRDKAHSEPHDAPPVNLSETLKIPHPIPEPETEKELAL